MSLCCPNGMQLEKKLMSFMPGEYTCDVPALVPWETLLVPSAETEQQFLPTISPSPSFFFPIHPYSCFDTGENPQNDIQIHPLKHFLLLLFSGKPFITICGKKSNGWQNNPTPPLTKMVIFTFPIAPS